ncbi:hypothetical protein M885DRAFT_543113 [Pelagophyceae sp. CCMP2097]|nr:hypothetical protein M885DRAFT_543113 [Pelagophyceae sp. CCMP2097]
MPSVSAKRPLLTKAEFECGVTLADKHQPSEQELLDDVADFFGHNQALVARCGAAFDRAGAARRFAALHKHYYFGSPLEGSDPPGRTVARLGPPRTWSGRDVLNCADAALLGEAARQRLRDEELYDADRLDAESPVQFLDNDDIAEVLSQGAESGGPGLEDAVFMLAVNYVKGSNRSCSRQA